MGKVLKFIKTHKIVLVLAIIIGIFPNLLVTDYSKQYNEEVAKIKSIKLEIKGMANTEDMDDLRKSVNTLKNENSKLEKEVQAKQAELDKLKNN
ncbi:hypothetical protein [Clostridium sp. B9]|uniref:hypothetical protein n=1 Tax=Clostridium sp. B9 TaxID=3423224 RepID=UPI003D2F31C9